MEHVHVSAMDALVVFAYVLIVGALWRAMSAFMAARGEGKMASIGQAMALAF